MSVKTPDNTSQVEDRIKADVSRSAPDSDPYLKVHWLRSLIAGISRRIFDFYEDLTRTESRLFPDTADAETAPRWGNIYVGPQNPATTSTGNAVAIGASGSQIPIGATLTANGNEYTVTSGVTISDNVISITSITRSGTTASALTNGDHGLSSSVEVVVTGADQSEYNKTTNVIVTGSDSFQYEVTGSPVSPATGSPVAEYTSGRVIVISNDAGQDQNLEADTPMSLQSPIVGVDDSLSVDFGAIGGGSDEEGLIDYKDRYLDKIRNPVAHFNVPDITQAAKSVTGVTRVFVQRSGFNVGSFGVTSITRVGDVATVTTSEPHHYDDGQLTTITGAVEGDYNVVDSPIIIEGAFTFHYIVSGSPSTPASGTIEASARIPLGVVRTFFMRDNDENPIPSGSEVQTVKDAIDVIVPANTSPNDNIVRAPTAVTIDYTFTELTPDTPTMRAAVSENISQFHDEQVSVGVGVDEDAYRAAIKNTVDTQTGDIVQSFELSTPSGDIPILSDEIAIKGQILWP